MHVEDVEDCKNLCMSILSMQVVRFLMHSMPKDTCNVDTVNTVSIYIESGMVKKH